MISNSHLKKHGVTAAEYKAKYPGAVLRIQTEESKKKISENKRNSVAWNKGIKTGPNTALSKAKQGKKLGQRNPLSDEVKAKISNSVKSALSNGVSKETRDKISNSLKQRYMNGHIGPFSGKTHTEQTKTIISSASVAALSSKRELWLSALSDKLTKDNIQVNGLNGQYINLKCLGCQAVFTFTRQYFSASSQKNHNSITEKICPGCYPRNTSKSAKELELLEFIRSIAGNEVVLSGNRAELYPRELDIFIPGKKLAIEFCGNYWHAENVSRKTGDRTKYHIFEKYIAAQEKGIRLITIFEDEWVFKNDIVKSRLSHLFKKTNVVIPARKTVAKIIDAKTSTDFLNTNHIQGADRPEVAAGLYFGDELISVMTLKKTSFVKGGKGDCWELNRFSSKLGTSTPGAAGKLLKFLSQSVEIKKIISYSDNRWSDGNVYKTLGFEYAGFSKPGYWYLNLKHNENGCTRIHRSNFMKHRLSKIFNKSFDGELSEWEIMQQEGYDRIWDCGTTKWELTL